MRAKKVDGPQAAIVSALRAAGCSVRITNLPDGGPDLQVGRYTKACGGVTFCLEVKSEHGKLNPLQNAFRAGWCGHYAVVHNVDEAFLACGLINEHELAKALKKRKKAA